MSQLRNPSTVQEKHLVAIESFAFGSRNAFISHSDSHDSRLNLMADDSYFDVVSKTILCNGRSTDLDYDE